MSQNLCYIPSLAFFSLLVHVIQGKANPSKQKQNNSEKFHDFIFFSQYALGLFFSIYLITMLGRWFQFRLGMKEDWRR